MPQVQIKSAMSLESLRLLLRDLQANDFQAVHEFASSTQVVEFQDWGPNSESETREFIQASIEQANRIPRLSYELAIIEKSSGQLVGASALFIKSSGREAELGFSLNPKFWNQGFATEAATAMLDFAFRHLQIQRVFATCRPENSDSITVLRKCSMQEEGLLRDHKLIRGKWCDSIVFAALNDEWLKV